MRSRFWLTMSWLVVLSLLVAACGGAATPAPATQAPAAQATEAPAAPTTAPSGGASTGEKFKVAFVYVAPIGDLGWTWAQDQGRLAVENELGDKVETAYIENVPEGPEATRVIRDFAQKGYNLIFTTSFGFMDPTVEVAKEFPNTWFVHVSGYKTAPNLSTVFGRMYRMRYLSGLVAGKATTSNIIGYVAAFPIPEVIRGINAFTQGVRAVNPKAEVRVVWTNTWFGPPQEKEAAEALLDQGADVIAQHQDTTEPQKAAADRGAVSIGYDSDMRKFVGETVLTSPIWVWGPKYAQIVKDVMAGTYKTESYWGEEVVDLAPFSDRVPDGVQELVDSQRDVIESEKADVFCGPLKNTEGQVIVEEGKCLTDEEMLSMDYFVEGVKGEAPKVGQPGLGQPSDKVQPARAVGSASGGATAMAEKKSKLKVAFVYVGPVGDLGWSYAHDQGRLAMEKALGDKVETAYSELVAEGADAERVIRDYAQKGYDLIFATSFGYMDSVINVARDFPGTIFEHATGYKTADNVGIYDGRGYQGWYLAGMTAGRMTKSNKLGYVAPYPIPEVVRNMNAFTLGARSVNPKVEVRPVWIYAWFDPAKEREAAQALIDAQVDVVARESDSAEPDKLAQEEGVYAIGYNAVSSDVAPDAVLTAPIWHWGVYYTQTADDVLNGTWTSEPVWWGMKEGILDLAPFGKMVPQSVQDEVNAARKKIESGAFDVFVGPIKDNTGTQRVPAGQAMSDEEKLAFDWLVEGVVGEIPK